MYVLEVDNKGIVEKRKLISIFLYIIGDIVN